MNKTIINQKCKKTVDWYVCISDKWIDIQSYIESSSWDDLAIRISSADLSVTLKRANSNQDQLPKKQRNRKSKEKGRGKDKGWGKEKI